LIQQGGGLGQPVTVLKVPKPPVVAKLYC
jgi:hypothetical protein